MVTRPLSTRKKSSVLSCLCQTNAPLTFTTIRSCPLNSPTVQGCQCSAKVESLPGELADGLRVLVQPPQPIRVGAGPPPADCDEVALRVLIDEQLVRHIPFETRVCPTRPAASGGGPPPPRPARATCPRRPGSPCHPP